MNSINGRCLRRQAARTLMVGLVALCALSNAARGAAATQTYGPEAGQWGASTVVADGVAGITWKITNNRLISIRFCAYKNPPGCPAFRIVGGPNANEIACSGSIAAGGVSNFVVNTCCNYKMCAFRTNARLSRGETEVEDGGSTEGITPPECAVPTVSEWGIIVMTVLGLTAGTIVFRRRRALRTS